MPACRRPRRAVRWPPSDPPGSRAPSASAACCAGPLRRAPGRSPHAPDRGLVFPLRSAPTRTPRRRLRPARPALTLTRAAVPGSRGWQSRTSGRSQIPLMGRTVDAQQPMAPAMEGGWCGAVRCRDGRLERAFVADSISQDRVGRSGPSLSHSKTGAARSPIVVAKRIDHPVRRIRPQNEPADLADATALPWPRRHA